MPRFQAEMDQMVSVAQQLNHVVAELSAEGHGALSGGCLGQGEAEDALSEFVSNWSHGRSEIAKGVQGLQSGLVWAADMYRRMDAEFAARIAAAGGGS